MSRNVAAFSCCTNVSLSKVYESANDQHGFSTRVIETIFAFVSRAFEPVNGENLDLLVENIYFSNYSEGMTLITR